MTLQNQAKNSVIWAGIQQFGNQGISFIVSIVLARILLPEEFGLIGMIAVFMAIGKSLINSGMNDSLIRTENIDEDDYSTILYFNILISVFIYFSLYFAAPFIANFYNKQVLTEIIRVYCLLFIVNSFSIIHIAKLSKNLDFKTQLKITLPSLIVGGLTGIVLALKGYGVWSLVYSAIVQSITKTIQLWIYSKWIPVLKFNLIKLKKHWNFGSKLLLSSILNSVFENIYQIIIGKYYIASDVGFYQRANSLKQLPVSNVSSVLNRVTYPIFSKIQNDDIKLQKAYKNIMQIVIFIMAPVLLLMASLAEPLFRFLFTEKWLPAVPFFQILCFNGILYPVHSYNLNILKVKGNSRLFLNLEILKKIVIIILITIGLQFGIYGLILSSVVSSIIAFFINSHYSGKYLSYSTIDQIKDITPSVFFALIMPAIVYFFNFYLLSNLLDIYQLLIGGLLGVSIYLILSFTFKLASLESLKKNVLSK